MCEDCTNISAEQKSLITDIANTFIKLFDVKRFEDKVKAVVRANYIKGTERVEEQLNFNVNFNENQGEIQKLDYYVLDNIKGLTDELEKKIRQQIQISLINKEDRKQLTKRIAQVFTGNNPTRFKFEDRIKMIVKTESERASNIAAINAAEQYGGCKKYLLTRGSKACALCQAAGSKYIREKAIPTDKEFILKFDGKTYRNTDGIWHPNCMCGVSIIKD